MQVTCASTEIQIVYCDIPVYLHSSAFYLELCGENCNESISIPRHLFKIDCTVSRLEDFRLLLNVLVFWGLDEIPSSVLDYCLHTKVSVWGPVSSQLPDNGILHNVLTSCFANYCSIGPVISADKPEILSHWMLHNTPDQTATREAAKFGKLQLLMDLHEMGCPWTAETPHAAASMGSLSCLQYALSNGCNANESCCSAAAQNGHLQCLQYLREEGCPWHESISYCAADGGHLDCLRFIYESGCPWDAMVSCCRDFDCLKYALERGCPTHDTAARNASSLNSLRLLRKYGATWDRNVTFRSFNLSLEHFQYMMEHGCPYDSDLVLAAVSLNRVDCLKIMVESVLLALDATVFSVALLFGSYECVVYLQDVGCPCDFIWPSHDYPDVRCDEIMRRGIQYVTEHGWRYNAELMRYVCEQGLALCREYLSDEGAVYAGRAFEFLDECHTHTVDNDSQPLQRCSPMGFDVACASSSTGHLICLQKAVLRGDLVHAEVCSELTANGRNKYMHCVMSLMENSIERGLVHVNASEDFKTCPYWSNYCQQCHMIVIYQDFGISKILQWRREERGAQDVLHSIGPVHREVTPDEKKIAMLLPLLNSVRESLTCRAKVRK